MKRPLTFSPARESVDALDAGARAAAGELRELQAHKATNGYKSPRSAKMAEGFGGGGPYRNHLGDSEITRRAASLSAAEWELLRRLAPEPPDHKAAMYLIQTARATALERAASAIEEVANLSRAQMRLQAGEMSEGEIRTAKAWLTYAASVVRGLSKKTQEDGK